MSNQLISHWVLAMINMGNRWVIEAPKFCRLSITHRWHRLLIDVIDYSSMTHRLLIDYYTAHERHFSCFLVPFFSFVILLSVLDAVFLVSDVPVDDVETQSANHKYRWFLIVQFENWTTLLGQPSRCGLTKTAKRYWRNFWSLISVCYLRWPNTVLARALVDAI